MLIQMRRCLIGQHIFSWNYNFSCELLCSLFDHTLYANKLWALGQIHSLFWIISQMRVVLRTLSKKQRPWSASHLSLLLSRSGISMILWHFEYFSLALILVIHFMSVLSFAKNRNLTPFWKFIFGLNRVFISIHVSFDSLLDF